MTCLLLWTLTRLARHPWMNFCSGEASQSLPASCDCSILLSHPACLDVAKLPSGTNQSCRLLRGMVTCWVQRWNQIQMMKVQAEHTTSIYDTD